MVKEAEIEVRTFDKGMLICTAVRMTDGRMKLIGRKGKKEDSILLDDFLTQIYGRSVMVTAL